jgi:hypothetical protein
MKKSILKVLAIVGSIESVGCFLVEEPAMGYIFAVIAIPSILELTNMHIKEQEQNEDSSK